ncbi:MAG: HEAT repeat domain-containing protein [Deltaproteobacteria bacterium]|nr:HEAT repeat domain-containing protein [Deltaproteobacteria bacterium]
MSAIKEQLANMFVKVMSGTVSMEEGTMLINSLAKKDSKETVAAISEFINTPPQNISAQTVFHTIAITRNRAFFDVLTATLDHKNEEISIFACEELATYFKNESKFVLVEHLNSDAYHVRKSSAATLTKIFGDEGIAALGKHILGNTQSHYHRLTSAEALVKAGKKGIDALMNVLNTGGSGAAAAAAEALSSVAASLSDAEMQMFVNALMKFGDAKDAETTATLIKAIGSFGKRAKQFAGFVRAYADDPDEGVSKEAKNTLKAIGG